MRKLLPTTVFVEDLNYHESTNDVGQKFDMNVTGRITIDFVSACDISEFLVRHPNGDVTIQGLSEAIGYALINKDIEI